MDKLLITGGTSFIGSHLAELCVQRGFEDSLKIPNSFA